MTDKQITSVQAWRSPDVQSRVLKLRDRVLYVLKINDTAMTGSELNQALGSSSAHKRISELYRDGYISRGSVRKCTISGQQAQEWFALERRKEKPAHRPTQLQLGFRQFADLVAWARTMDYCIPTELEALGRNLRKKYGWED